MTKKIKGRPQQGRQPSAPNNVRESLLDEMKDGREFASIIGLIARDDKCLMRDVSRAFTDLEVARGRPCIAYCANMVRPVERTGIEQEDDLPFRELIASVSPSAREVDVLVVTPGGSAQQVNQFVEALRTRFDAVHFLLPARAMSAGTLWALSGDSITMGTGATIGPIDPQVPMRNGQFVPIQALMTLVDMIQQQGATEIKQGRQPPWSLIRMLDNIDPKEYGNALSMSKYVISLAQRYLNDYKFKAWTTRATSGAAVTDEHRQKRALEIAAQLTTHALWNSHGHGISRDMAEKTLHLRIEHAEADVTAGRALRRLWALIYYAFDRGPARKIFTGVNYTVVYNGPMPGGGGGVS